MLFKVDENLSPDIAAALRDAGHEADTCLEEGLNGRVDDEVYRQAVAAGRVLISQDIDFCDIRRYQPGGHPGVVVLRLHDQRVVTTLRAIQRLLSHLEQVDITGQIVIVEDTRIRVRAADVPT